MRWEHKAKAVPLLRRQWKHKAKAVSLAGRAVETRGEGTILGTKAVEARGIGSAVTVVFRVPVSEAGHVVRDCDDVLGPK